VPEQYQVGGKNAAAISASIEAGVMRGDYRWGDALPPVRVLAESLHVSPATVAKAYTELRRRGVVETDGRRGTRVRSRPPVASPRSALRPPVPSGVLDLSAGEPDTALLPSLGPLLHEVAATVGPPIGYETAGAMPELVDAARPRLAADGVPVSDAAITVTGGTLDAIDRLLAAHARPGDAVAIEDPGWANLLDLTAALGLRALPVEVDDEGPLPESLAVALRSGARAVIVTSRAQNPTGAAVTASRAAALRDLLTAFPEVLVVEDDHAAELAGVSLHCIGPVTGSWAFVRSASKPFGPDLRIAVLAGDETTVARVVGRMRIGSGWVSTILQRVLLGLWRDAEVTAAIAGAARQYTARREALLATLIARGLDAHGATGINVWVRVADETVAVTALRDAGYAVAPGSRFRIATPPGIRLTVSGLDEQALGSLADAVAAAADPAAIAAPFR
jgi:DNA-binding transcriptional MocR family regulator